MARTGTEGRRVATEGAIVGGAATKASTAGAGTVASVSMVKFLRLMKLQPVEG